MQYVLTASCVLIIFFSKNVAATAVASISQVCIYQSHWILFLPFCAMYSLQPQTPESKWKGYKYHTVTLAFEYRHTHTPDLFEVIGGRVEFASRRAVSNFKLSGLQWVVLYKSPEYMQLKMGKWWYGEWMWERWLNPNLAMNLTHSLRSPPGDLATQHENTPLFWYICWKHRCVHVLMSVSKNCVVASWAVQLKCIASKRNWNNANYSHCSWTMAIWQGFSWRRMKV